MRTVGSTIPILVALALGAALLGTGCQGSLEERVELAKLSGSCVLDSDCREPLVCAFGKCHAECTTSRDCDEGARCVAGERPNHICQLPDELTCKTGETCPPGQVCGVDAECRDGCTTARDCLGTQVCTLGACAEPEELSESGALTPSEERNESLPLPCLLHSDCAAGLACSEGLCRAECTVDLDCPGDELCLEGRCGLPSSSGCFLNSDCAEGEVCTSGECVASSVGCSYGSDCPTFGQRCEEGQCVCACAVTADCGSGMVCQDACACVAGRVVVGNVVIENSAQLAELANVAEIRGTLQLQIAASGSDLEVVLPALRKASAVLVNDDGIRSVRLPALESVTTITLVGAKLVNFSAESLAEVGEISASAPILETLEFPELTVAEKVTIGSSGSMLALSLPKLATITSTGSFGSMALLQSLDLPLLASAGNLSFSNLKMTSLDLSSLATVSGYFQVNKTGLTSLNLPLLKGAGSLTVNTNSALKTLSAPLLKTVGTFEVMSNANLASFSFPELASGGSMSVVTCAVLNEVIFPKLTGASSLAVANNAKITTVSVPLCKKIALTVQSNPLLLDIDAPQMTELISLSVQSNASLEKLYLPLVASTGSFVITANSVLASLEYLDSTKSGSLTTAGNVDIELNASLSECLVSEFKDALTSYSVFYASGNLTCP